MKNDVIFIALLILSTIAMGQGKITCPKKYVGVGTFIMGATSETQNPSDKEKPTHQVTLSGFYIGQIEVTQTRWNAVMDYNPSERGIITSSFYTHVSSFMNVPMIRLN